MLTSYLYKEKSFYFSILISTGYGSLSAIMLPVLTKYIRDMLDIKDDNDPIIMLAADGLLAAMIRWLLSESKETPDIFINSLKESIIRLSKECIRNLA